MREPVPWPVWLGQCFSCLYNFTHRKGGFGEKAPKVLQNVLEFIEFYTGWLIVALREGGIAPRSRVGMFSSG